MNEQDDLEEFFDLVGLECDPMAKRLTTNERLKKIMANIKGRNPERVHWCPLDNGE